MLTSQKDVRSYNLKRDFITGGMSNLLNPYQFSGLSQGQSATMGMHNEHSSATQVLYGTNINSNEVQSKIRNFIQSFVVMDENSENY